MIDADIKMALKICGNTKWRWPLSTNGSSVGDVAFKSWANVNKATTMPRLVIRHVSSNTFIVTKCYKGTLHKLHLNSCRLKLFLVIRGYELDSFLLD